MTKSGDYNATKTPQSGSRAPYTEPEYSRTANTIPQKKRNNNSSPAGTNDVVYPGNTPSPTGGGGASRNSKKQGD